MVARKLRLGWVVMPPALLLLPTVIIMGIAAGSSGNVCQTDSDSSVSLTLKDTASSSGSMADKNSDIGKRISYMIERFKADGLSGDNISAIIAVGWRESNLNPKAVNPSGAVKGIFQWGSGGINGDRYGSTQDTVESQMDLAIKELKGSHKVALIGLSQAKNISESALAWDTGFEGVGANDGQRKSAQVEKWAQDIKTSRGVTFEVQLTQNRELGLEIIDRSLAMGHRITSVLSALNIARSTYYQWKNWHPSQQETRRNALKTAIKAVYNTNRGIYGYRRIAAFLRFILNTEVGDRLVWELMKNLDDLSGVLTTDITYIQLMNRNWVYLATVYDPEKRRVVSCGLSSEMTKEFATSVVVKALRANGKPKMIHSDMGSQYTSSLFEGTLQNAGIDHSYSRKGHPYDNARIESFHSLIKRELIYHEEYRTIDDVRASVEWYVNWYNNERINSRIEWLQAS